MDRTLPSIPQIFLQEQEAFSCFRRALRRSDQQALEDLFAAAHSLPFEALLLAMLLRLRRAIETLVNSASPPDP